MGQIIKAGDPSAYGFVLTDTITNGELAVWDPTATATSSGQTAANGAARPLSAGIGDNGAYFIGVFEGQAPIASNIDNANPQSPVPKILVRRTGIFPFKTTASQTYTHGTAVYAAASGDNLTITTTSSSNTLVGYVYLPDGASVTGNTGVTVNVEITNNTTYTSNSLLNA